MKRLLLAICALTLLAGATDAATLRVPSEYPTLLAALDAAADLDTVLVAPGEYSTAATRTVALYDGPEDISAVGFLRTDVILVSEAGPGLTTLRSPAALGPQGVLVAGLDDNVHAEIHGFRFVARSAGIWCTGATLQVSDCRFESEVPHEAWGLSSTWGGSVVRDCTFDGLASAIVHHGANLDLRNSTITGCSGLFGAVHVNPGPYGPNVPRRPNLIIEECAFTGNHGDYYAGAVSTVLYTFQGESYAVDTRIQWCAFADNSSDGAGGALGLETGNRVWYNTFLRNESAMSGGAIHMKYGGSARWNTFHRNHSGALSVEGVGSVEVDRNIFSRNTGFLAFLAAPEADVNEGCNLYWINLPGNSNLPLDATDILADPLFCDEAFDDLTLQTDSPAAPANSPVCGRIGALDPACGAVSVEAMSWGRIKGSYR